MKILQRGCLTQKKKTSQIDLGSDPGKHVLDLYFDVPGVQVFAFTFG